MECALCKVQYVGKAETALNIGLNKHRKDVNNPKSIPADLHFKKPGHSFNLHAKFTLVEQLNNIYKTNKVTLKCQLKRREDFRTKKLETLTPKWPNQELNNAFLVRCSPFSISVTKLNASIISRNKEKLTSNFD